MLRFLISGTVSVALPILCRGGRPSVSRQLPLSEIATNGATVHVRVGGKGPAVVLLHGYAETGDMWANSSPSSAPYKAVTRAHFTDSHLPPNTDH